MDEDDDLDEEEEDKGKKGVCEEYKVVPAGTDKLNEVPEPSASIQLERC